MIISPKYYASGSCHLSDVYKTFNDYYRVYKSVKDIYNEKFYIVMTDVVVINQTLADIASRYRHRIERFFIEEGYPLNNDKDLVFLINKLNINNE